MRLLHLYSGNLYGGIESYLVTLARLRTEVPEIQSEFGLCFPGRLREELLAAGGVVHDLGEVRLSRPWTVWQSRRKLNEILTADRRDAVVVHGCWSHAVFGPTVRKRNLPLVHSLHDNLEHPTRLDRLAGRTSPNLVVANSRFTAAAARKVFPHAPIEVCYLPVRAPTPISPDERRNMRRGLGAGDDVVVVLQVSRLERWKGQRALLEALSLLKDRPSWQCWIAGGPQRRPEAEYLAQLKDYADDAGIGDRVQFLGQRGDVAKLMASADIFCQANTGPEPFGIVFVEALLAGLPIVTSNLGGAAEIVDARSGLLVPPADVGGLAQALKRLIDDAQLRAELSQASPQRGAQLCDPVQQVRRLGEWIAGAASIGNRVATSPKIAPTSGKNAASS